VPAAARRCLYTERTDKHALVLVSVRLDGQVEIVSNSTEAAWEQVHALFGHPPSPRSLHDFEVLSSGWVPSGVAVLAFGALVRTKWRQWDEGRGKAAAARKQKERERRERQAALLEWLKNLALDELHPQLIREGIDLTTLQFVTEDDLTRVGVSQLAQRRQLLAAVKTQKQYQHLTERVATLEAATSALELEKAHTQGELQQRSEELGDARADVESLTSALAAERAAREQAEADAAAARLELATSQTRVADLEARVASFAADVEALLERKANASEGQRQTMHDLRKSIELETLNLKDRVRKGEGLARRTPSVADGNVSGGSRRLTLRNGHQSSSAGAAATDGSLSEGGAAGAASSMQPACR